VQDADAEEALFALEPARDVIVEPVQTSFLSADFAWLYILVATLVMILVILGIDLWRKRK